MNKQTDKWDGNSPEAFGELSPLEQQALRLWVRLALEPTPTIRRNASYPVANFSYGLKHNAERALGWYVSNGELKGAMLAEGYRWEYEGRGPYPTINWIFNSKRRCPHRQSHKMGSYGYSTCPLADRVPIDSYHAFPSICQATEEEIAEFDDLRARAGRASIGSGLTV